MTQFANRAGSFLQGLNQGLSPYMQAMLQHRLNEEDRKNRLADALTQSGQTTALDMAMRGQAQPISPTVDVNAGTVPMGDVQTALKGQSSVGPLAQPPSTTPVNPLSTLTPPSQVPAHTTMPNPERPNFTITPEMAKASQNLVKPGGYRLGQQTGLYSEAEIPAIAKKYSDQGMDVKFKPSATTPGKYEMAEVNQKPEKTAATGVTTDTDVKSTAAGIANGDIPPDPMMISFRDRTRVLGELEKSGFDFQKANLDYKAATKFMQTANSTQQVRLRQAITSVRSSLDSARQMSADFKRTGFAPANKVELMAAANGALGPDKAKQASDFIAQLTVIQDELGQVFMGGNSPTDNAFKLSGQLLNKNYSFEQLNGVFDTLDKNLTYRENALKSVGVQGIGGPVDKYNAGTAAQGVPTNQTAPTSRTGQLQQQILQQQHPTVGGNFNGQTITKVTQIQ